MGNGRYGLPYKGSKNHIAEWIVDNLPPADVFCDLFFGGGAVTHRALLTDKYKQFVVNDIDGRLPKLFLDCCYGKYTLENHKEWISREEFFRLKDDDAYIALVWSFANNGVDYLYAKDLEPFKKALHYAVFFSDLSLMNEQGITLNDTEETDIYQRYLWFARQLKFIKKNPVYFENLTRAIEIERLQSLQSLQSLQEDYVSAFEKVKMQYAEKGLEILTYCDIPYQGSNCGKYKGFDNDRFHEWAREQDNIYISEYTMPDDFKPVAWCEKNILSAANGNSDKAIEKLFVNERTYWKLNKDQRYLISLNFSKQISLFDLMEDSCR